MHTESLSCLDTLSDAPRSLCHTDAMLCRAVTGLHQHETDGHVLAGKSALDLIIKDEEDYLEVRWASVDTSGDAEKVTTSHTKNYRTTYLWFKAVVPNLFLPFKRELWKMKPTQKCKKLQCFEWPLEAGSKSESIPIDIHVKMPNFTAEINMFIAWYKKRFSLYSPFMTTVYLMFYN